MHQAEKKNDKAGNALTSAGRACPSFAAVSFNYFFTGTVIGREPRVVTVPSGLCAAW